MPAFPPVGRDLRGDGGASEGYPVGRAPHPRRALVEDVSVDHRGADTPVVKPLLDGADVVAGLWPTAKGAGNRRPLMADVRSLFRRRTRAARLPTGGCGPLQPPKSSAWPHSLLPANGDAPRRIESPRTTHGGSDRVLMSDFKADLCRRELTSP